MQRAVTKWLHCALVAFLAAWPRLSLSAPFQADASSSQLVIRAGRTGLLSTLAHDHLFTPGRWQADVEFDPERPEAIHVDVRIEAATLHDHVARLSPKFREYVDRETAGPDVLDAQRYREIRFRGESASARDDGDGLRGVLHGALSLHGRTRALDVPFHARADAAGYRVSGSVRFRQTDYGMTPFSSAAGTIRVDDEIEVGFDLVLVPPSGVAGSLLPAGG